MKRREEKKNPKSVYWNWIVERRKISKGSASLQNWPLSENIFSDLKYFWIWPWRNLGWVKIFEREKISPHTPLCSRCLTKGLDDGCKYEMFVSKLICHNNPLIKPINHDQDYPALPVPVFCINPTFSQLCSMIQNTKKHIGILLPFKTFSLDLIW